MRSESILPILGNPNVIVHMRMGNESSVNIWSLYILPHFLRKQSNILQQLRNTKERKNLASLHTMLKLKNTSTVYQKRNCGKHSAML